MKDIREKIDDIRYHLEELEDNIKSTGDIVNIGIELNNIYRLNDGIICNEDYPKNEIGILFRKLHEKIKKL